jgi:hypothetical protein
MLRPVQRDGDHFSPRSWTVRDLPVAKTGARRADT